MNRNSDGFDDYFLEWLNPVSQSSANSNANLDSERTPSQWVDLPQSSEHPSLELGEESVIEDRFYALLRQRIRNVIETHPPLFPWESELVDYQDVPVSTAPVAPGALAAATWLPQLQALKLPFSLPQPVLLRLLQHCQGLNSAVLREGERLVQAVETFFPDCAELLPRIAGQVMLGPARYHGEQRWAQLGSKLPGSYEQASVEQQIFATMLAAQELFDSLQLDLFDRTAVTQRWQTVEGEIVLTVARLAASHQTDFSQWAGLCLVIEAVLPVAGTLSINVADTVITAEKVASGRVRCLIPAEPSQSFYPVRIQLGAAQAPLELVIRL
jgi:hypothetical protein